MHVEPGANVDRPDVRILDICVAPWIRQWGKRACRSLLAPALSICSGFRIQDVSLILTPSHRKKGAYERLGILHEREDDRQTQGSQFVLKMPKRVQRSSFTLV